MPIVASREISSAQEEFVVVRTSDRMLFKRCRRLWGWTSHLKMGLQIKEQPDYFWFGTGIHYALEDYHGINKYGHPGKAFLAYVEATRRSGAAPPTWNDLQPLGLTMMSYYADYWLQTRDPLQTFLVGGKPQLEIHGYIDLGIKHRGKRVVYGFTMDRMIEDEHGILHVAEYKSYKSFQWFHLDTDEQCTAYCACASKLYNRPALGVYYYQFLKRAPALPKVLANGTISTNTAQATTAALYRRMLCDVFGTVERSPAPNRKCLQALTVEETEDQDRFIRREHIERNQTQLDTFWERIMLELEDILDEDLPLYPNQTRDCSWSCPLQAACIAIESGADYEDALRSYAQRPTIEVPDQTAWRKYLPKQVQLPAEAEIYQQLMQEVEKGGAPDTWEPQMSPEEAFLSELY